MAPNTVTVTVVDEGYFKKVFRFSPTTNLKKLLDTYRAHICGTCSNANLLDFWYETTKVSEGHNANALGMQTGDIIDVRVAEQCTRGACPLPPSQTLPNIHYLYQAPNQESGPIQEQQEQPEEPKRITMTIKDQNGFEMVLRTKVDTLFRKIKNAYGAQADREAWLCRLFVDGQRLNDDQTPAQVRILYM